MTKRKREKGKILVKLKPPVVRLDLGPLPPLTVRIRPLAPEEAVLGALDHVEPRVWLRVFAPLLAVSMRGEREGERDTWLWIW